MNINELKNLTESLLETFLSAGQKAIELRKKGLKTIFKSDNSPVTNGDLEVDKLIRKRIFQTTPNIPLISEETVNLNKNNEYKNFWLVDPIDGTKEYLNNKDEFTLNAALIIDLKPVIGIIYVPAKKRLFYSYGRGYAYEEFEQKKIKLDCKKKTTKGKVFAVTNTKNPSQLILDILKKK